MKVAVINFSGNVGKTTVARHLLQPRIAGAELVCVESINADDHQAQALRGRQFGELQEYLQTIDSVVVDIGASNVEDLLGLMKRYKGSQEDFDCFIVPTVAGRKQQQDTVATLIELARMGVAPSRVRLVFNMVEDDVPMAQAFDMVLAFVSEKRLAQADVRCQLGANELYHRLKGTEMTIAELMKDKTDYKALIAKARSTPEKLALAQKLATRRLATGVLPELDACFAAIGLGAAEATAKVAPQASA
jgi:hypothetical protein